ncbi:MAG: ketoacyl-ACP synthase III [Bacteroidetes bacterium]|nr:ketoacyl-ACP synthase III [Bacteroidota bacterium]NCQ10920.1 ketoacyl-ACP synthase III [Bacteroidota bacterium]
MSEKILAKVTAVGHYLPDYIMTNQEMETLVDTNDEWITSRTGIKERRILKDPEKATSYMATKAVEEILKRRGISASEIDAIIIATITPDYFFPAVACLVQRNIGADKAFGYDISAACSGFLFALSTGAQFIESGRYKKVLVIGADKMSSILDYSDRTTCILFGDAAAGVLLEPSDDGNGIIDYLQRCDGSGADYLIMKGGGSRHPSSHASIDDKLHYITQDGKSVFKKATEGMADIAAEIMEKHNLIGEDITWLVPHQANLRIIDATARRMGIGKEKVMINISKYGNTTAATIPLCLYDWKDQLKPGDNLILAAFGGGFTWGSTYIKWGI